MSSRLIRWPESALLCAALAVATFASLPSHREPAAERSMLPHRDLAPAERAAHAFPRAVRGERGDDGLTIARAPVRIVAASVFAVEVLTAIVPADRIAAVLSLAADARYCAAADEARKHTQCGAEPEQLLAQRPDLVVIDPFTDANTRFLLARADVPVLETRPTRTLADVVDNIRMLGWAIGRDREAEQLALATEARIAALHASADAVRAWRVLDLDGATSTYGRGSLLDDAIACTGAVNLAGARGLPSWYELDLEQLLGMRPDALLVAAAPADEARVLERLRSLPGVRQLPCVQKGRVVFVSGTSFHSTSPQVLLAAERLQQRLREWGTP